MHTINDLLADLSTAPPAPGEEADFEFCQSLRSRLYERQEVVGDVFEARGEGESAVAGEEAIRASVLVDKAQLLYRLTRLLRPTRVTEFGSAFGLSGAYIVRALAAEGNGELITVEGSPSRQAIAAATIEEASPGTGRSVCGYFDDHLDALDGAGLVFIDGDHNPDPTLGYVAAVVERAADPCTVVLDDVTDWSDEFSAMWRELQGDPRFSAWGEAAGVGVLVRGSSPVLAQRQDARRLAGVRRLLRR